MSFIVMVWAHDIACSWAGGVPIFADGVCVGGIGVSGAKDHEDLACAHALDAAGFADSA